MNEERVMVCKICGWQTEPYCFDGFSHIKHYDSIREHFNEKHPHESIINNLEIRSLIAKARKDGK